MDKFVIYQTSRLKGEVKINGAKNSALPIMAATLLTDEDCTIFNVPALSDVFTMIKLLEFLGKEVSFSRETLKIRTRNNKKYIAPYRLVRTMRASFCVLGPLIARRNKAKVSFPGGCIIGPRPVDLHLKGLEELGAHINIDKGYCIAEAKELRGKEVFLGGSFGSSVLATANILMAAVLSKGTTVIESAACEPEITDLASFLKQMGAKINGEGTPTITVEGVDSLRGAAYQIIPDRIEAATFIAAAIATGSSIVLKNVIKRHLSSVVDTAKKMGQEIIFSDSTAHIKAKKPIKPANITTLPYPGFPTDLQAQFMSCLCLAEGISLVTEKVYPDRFMHVSELNRMGAKIIRNGPYAVIGGVKKLKGAEVMASDLRASAALVVAGLAAQGRTDIFRIYHLDRGYYKLEERLKQLGAKIKRVKA